MRASHRSVDGGADPRCRPRLHPFIGGWSSDVPYGSVTERPPTSGMARITGRLPCSNVYRASSDSSCNHRAAGSPRTALGGRHVCGVGDRAPRLLRIPDRPGPDADRRARRQLGRRRLRAHRERALHRTRADLPAADGPAHAGTRDPFVEHRGHDPRSGVGRRRIPSCSLIVGPVLARLLPHHVRRSRPAHAQARRPDGSNDVAGRCGGRPGRGRPVRVLCVQHDPAFRRRHLGDGRDRSRLPDR